MGSVVRAEVKNQQILVMMRQLHFLIIVVLLLLVVPAKPQLLKTLWNLLSVTDDNTPDRRVVDQRNIIRNSPPQSTPGIGRPTPNCVCRCDYCPCCPCDESQFVYVD